MKTKPFAEYLDTVEMLRAYLRGVLDECENDFHSCDRCGHQDNNATKRSNLYLLLKDAVR